MRSSNIKNMRSIRRGALICLIFIIMFSAGVYGADFELVSGSIGHEPFVSSGGAFSLTGTIEPSMGSVSSGEGFVVNSGTLPGNIGCEVNLVDLLIIAEAWLGTSDSVAGDVDNNGRVDIADFSHVAYWWYSTCPAQWQLK